MTSSMALQEQLRARARVMVPELKERALQCERDRCVPNQTIQAFQDAGFFRILQPKRWGGYELHPNDFYDVQMILAEGCMSSAWVLGVIAIHNWQMALFDDRAAQDVWGEDDSVLISSSYMPVGKVTRVDGGLLLSGEWAFSSGCDHCDWVFLGAIVPPLPGQEDQPPQMRTFLLPRKDYDIVDDWYVMGLKGTGSKTVVVKDALVPEYRTHKALDGFLCQNPGNAVNQAALFRMPFGQVFVRAVSTSAIGALQGAIDHFKSTVATRVGKSDGKSAGEDPFAQQAVAEAGAIVDELKLVLHRNFDRLMEAASIGSEVAGSEAAGFETTGFETAGSEVNGAELTIDERIKMRYDSALVIDKCVQGVDKLFAFAGGSGIYEGHPVLRCFLDIHAGRAHTANNPYKFGKNWGAVQLGQPNTDFFL
jgi:3-hydroxy-9,10-secoandrosta-1,3,5(10)-triene-9,17-dione monooxygenase